MDYVLSFWSPPQGGFKSVLNNAAWCSIDTPPKDLHFELIQALSDPSIDTPSTVTTLTSSDHSPQLQLPLGDTHFEFPNVHTHITPEGSNFEPRYITHDGSPIDSGMSPTFTTSPAFNTSCNVTLFDPSTLADRFDIADLGQSFVNISNPSNHTFPLCSAYWTPQTTMTTPPAPSSSFQETPVGPKPESTSDGIPPPAGIPPLTTPTATQLMELLGHFIVQSANQPMHEPRTLEMHAKGHSAMPKFDDEPANLESYFTELEYQFDKCRITSTYDHKVQAMRYLNAAPCCVWRGTEVYENDKRTWEDFKDEIYKLYPGLGSEQRLNVSDILSFVNTNAHAAYPNEKELGAYYRHLLSDTTMMIRSNSMTQHEQSLIYLRGLPDLLHQQTICCYHMKNLDRHPKDLPPIVELYDESAFCVLGGGLTMTIANAPVPTAVPVMQAFPATVPLIFGMMAPSLAPIIPNAPTVPSAAAPVQPTAQPTVNQPLPFAPGLHPEEFSALLANSIAEKMSALFGVQGNSAPHGRLPQGGGNCNFCGQANHYVRTCETAARYLTKSRCKCDQQG